MKKILILFIILLSSYIRKVNAEVIYGNYYKVDTIKEEQVDEIRINSYKLYNTYKIEYEDLGYIEENDLYIKDLNDYIYEEKLCDNINNSTEYATVNLSKINKEKLALTIGNINLGAKINEIEVYYKGEKVNYEIGNEEDFNKFGLNIDKIYDNNLETFYSHNVSYLSIYIKFIEKYNLEDIQLIIHTDGNNKIGFLFYYDNRPQIILNNNDITKHIISFNITDDNVGNVEYLYKKNIKLYKHYKENFIKENVYVKEGDNLILGDYIEINEYYKRDKLVLNDNLIIDSKDKLVENFIEYSSDNVNVLCNIDYQINGVYKCNFILNDINIEKDIFVNINNNAIIEEELIEIPKENEREEKEEEKYKDIIDNLGELEEIIDIKEENEEIKESITLEDKNIIKDELNTDEPLEILESKDKLESMVDDLVIYNKDESVEEKILDEKPNIIVDNTRVTSKKYIKKTKTNEQNINNTIKKDKVIIEKESIKSNNIHYDEHNNNVKIFIIIFLIVLIFIKIIFLIKRKRNNVESI